MSQCLTGKTIGELSTLSGLSGNTLFIVEQDGVTYNIPFSAFGIDVNSCLTEILTYSQMTGETSTNSLKPGCFYMITDADSTLYSGGTNIVIQAITSNQLALQGHGLFYTPPYDKNVVGFNVWYSGGTYGIGNDVYWGGYVWENLTGSVGSSTDIYTLDGTNWSAKTYNYSGYNTSIDVIHYDFSANTIIYRKDKFNNEVSVSKYDIYYFLNNPPNIHPIKSFQWGNGLDITLQVGISDNYIYNSLFECINFRGIVLRNNTLNNNSYVYNNSYEGVSYFEANTLNDSTIINNTLNTISFFKRNILENGSSISQNILDNASYFSANTLNNSTIINNTLNYASFFKRNILENGSSILQNILDDISHFETNKLDNSSSFNTNTLDNYSSFRLNSLTNGSIFQLNNLDSTSNILGNTLTYSSIGFNVLNNGTINYNILTKPTPLE
jgi:hypothetical protein